MKVVEVSSNSIEIWLVLILVVLLAQLLLTGIIALKNGKDGAKKTTDPQKWDPGNRYKL